jgi:hypothetical protein
MISIWRYRLELSNWTPEGRSDSCQLDILEVDGSKVLLALVHARLNKDTYESTCIAEANKEIDNVWLSQNLVLNAWSKS